MALEVGYSDSAIPWVVFLPAAVLVVLALWLVSKRNKGAAKVIAIVVAVMVLGAIAVEVTTVAAFDCDQKSDGSRACRSRF